MVAGAHDTSQRGEARVPGEGARGKPWHGIALKRSNHWRRRRPDDYVDYPRQKRLDYLEECRLIREAAAAAIVRRAIDSGPTMPAWF